MVCIEQCSNQNRIPGYNKEKMERWREVRVQERDLKIFYINQKKYWELGWEFR